MGNTVLGKGFCKTNVGMSWGMPHTLTEVTYRPQKIGRCYMYIFLGERWTFWLCNGTGQGQIGIIYKVKTRGWEKYCYTIIQCKIELYVCYSSVKYKSISLKCSTKIIKSAPKQKRYTSVFMLRAGQLSALEKCTSRLEGNNWVSNCTNLNHVSNQ